MRTPQTRKCKQHKRALAFQLTLRMAEMLLAGGALQVAHYLAYATATHYGHTRHPAATSLGLRPPGPLHPERARELQRLQQRARQEQYLHLQQQEQRGGHETEAVRGAVQSDAHVHVDLRAHQLQPDPQRLMREVEGQGQRQRGSRSQVEEEVEAVRREMLLSVRMLTHGLLEGHHDDMALHGVTGGGGQSPGYHDAAPSGPLSVSPTVSPSRSSTSRWGDGWLESCLGGALEGRGAGRESEKVAPLAADGLLYRHAPQAARPQQVQRLA